jgi:hypothetical protein
MSGQSCHRHAITALSTALEFRFPSTWPRFPPAPHPGRRQSSKARAADRSGLRIAVCGRKDRISGRRTSWRRADGDSACGGSRTWRDTVRRNHAAWHGEGPPIAPRLRARSGHHIVCEVRWRRGVWYSGVPEINRRASQAVTTGDLAEDRSPPHTGPRVPGSNYAWLTLLGARLLLCISRRR